MRLGFFGTRILIFSVAPSRAALASPTDSVLRFSQRSEYTKARVSGLMLLNVVADAELLDQDAVLFDIAVLDVLEKAAALTDKHHKATTSVVILLVLLEVLGKVANTLGKNCDLDLGCAGILFTFAEFFDKLCGAFFGNAVFISHDFHLSFR